MSVGTRVRSVEWCHFQWPWTTLSDLVKYSVTRTKQRAPSRRQLNFLCVCVEGLNVYRLLSEEDFNAPNNEQEAPRIAELVGGDAWFDDYDDEEEQVDNNEEDDWSNDDDREDEHDNDDLATVELPNDNDMLANEEHSTSSQNSSLVWISDFRPDCFQHRYCPVPFPKRVIFAFQCLPLFFKVLMLSFCVFTYVVFPVYLVQIYDY